MPSAYPMGTVHHPVLGKVQWRVDVVSDDPDTQVEQTIALMRRYAIEDSASPLLNMDAQVAKRGDPVDDTWAYLSRKEGVRSMHFVHDEDTGAPWADMGRWRPVVETLMRPCDQVVAPQPQGDCDDFSMYGAAHLLTRGVPCSFVTVAADSADPSIYSHVYLAAYPRTGKYAGRRVPLDLSHGGSVGWETANKYGKRREWPVSNSAFDQFDPCSLLLLAAGGFFLYRICVEGLN